MIGNWYHFHLMPDEAIGSFREALELFQASDDETMTA